MQELLDAIKARLQSELAHVRDRDIYITPHIGFIPQGVKRPCIGIKDGKVEHSYGAGYSKDYSMGITLAIFCDLGKKEAAVSGDNGVLEIQKACITALEGNKLGLSGMDRVRVVFDPESELFMVKNGSEMVRKKLGLLYEKRGVATNG